MTDRPLYLDGGRLAALLTPPEALGALQGFFGAHGREAVRVPPRIHLGAPGRSTIGLYMPAATGDYIGLKVVHLMPDRFPSVEAEIFLYDAETGRLLFWGDGKPMTGLRTAGVSAAASLRLLPRCRTLALFGAGLQATAHVAAFASAYPELETIWAVTRSQAGFERLLGSLPEPLRGLPRRCETPQIRLPEVDCVIATTPAPEPLFRWSDLSPRCHVVGIGSATHEMNELPPEAFLQGRLWVDTANAIEESGDLRAAMKQGWSESRLEGDLFDLLGAPQGAVPPPPKHPPDDAAARTVFKSVGHAAQDLAILVHLWERLRQQETSG